MQPFLLPDDAIVKLSKNGHDGGREKVSGGPSGQRSRGNYR